ncbi:CRE-ASP-5 protein [Aphelenchoides besseyi]|nr:CRE-ASP-5 protein [Aphelenchoides besseyi]
MYLIFLGFLCFQLEGDQFKLGLKKGKSKNNGDDSGTKLNGFQANRAMRFYDAFEESIVNTNNIWYKATITLGNPPQTFEIQVDSGSDITWIAGRDCTSSGASASNCVSQTNVYDANISTTSRNTTRQFDITYGTGKASGWFFEDNFAIGDPNSPQLKYKNKVTFGVGQDMSFSDTGILGLSFSNGDHPTPIFILGVRDGIFNEPIFTAFFADCDSEVCEQGGQITFGGYDEDNCEAKDQIHWVPMDSITAGAFTIGPVKIQESYIDETRHLQFVALISRLTARFNSGTSFILGPIADVQKLADAIGATTHDGAYFASCTADFTITFQIDSRLYPMHSKDLIIDNTNSNGICALALGSANFIRQYCQVHDVKERRVGFSRVRTSPRPASNVTSSPAAERVTLAPVQSAIKPSDVSGADETIVVPTQNKRPLLPRLPPGYRPHLVGEPNPIKRQLDAHVNETLEFPTA